MSSAAASKAVFAAASARRSVRRQRDVAASVALPRRSAVKRSVGRGAGLVCDAKLGIVGGSNLNDSSLFEHLEKRLVETEYGNVVVYDSPPDAEKQICFVKRHYCGEDESYVPPHLVKAPAFLKVGPTRGEHLTKAVTPGRNLVSHTTHNIPLPLPYTLPLSSGLSRHSHGVPTCKINFDD
jgi:hypothetical protein